MCEEVSLLRNLVKTEKGCMYLSEIGDTIWMQYTGLKDKNEKEIYEGDIIWTYVKCKSKDKRRKTIMEPYNSKEVVSWGIWQDDEYGYGIHTWLLGNDYLSMYKKYRNPHWKAIEEKFEVIGNIYENPELIK